MIPGPRSLWLRTLAAIGGIVCLAIVGRSAHATPELFVDLRYEIDPGLQGCPSMAEFRSIVGEQLGYDPYRPDATLRVEIRAQVVDRGLEGAVDWNDSAEERVGERRFTSRSRDCHELLATMGFVVAVQIQLLATDGTAASRPAPQPSSAEAAAPSASRGTEVTPAVVRPAPSAQSVDGSSADIPAPASRLNPWSAIVGVGPSVGLGLGPDPIAQGRVFVAVQYAMVSFELGAEASLPSTTRQNDGSGFRHNLILGTVAACGHYRPISACALGKLGEIQVHGLGVDVPASPSGFVAQIGPRLSLGLGLGDHLTVLAHADALYLLTPWTVDLNHTTIWAMSRFGALVGIDLAVRFR